MKVLVTGGSGFIGSNFINYLLTNPEAGQDISVINLDKLTYAARGNNLEHSNLSKHKSYLFIETDICDKEQVDKVFSTYKPDMVFNFAAESHVDRSISDTDSFEKTNFLGACNIFKAVLKYNIPKLVQISTDEVYGSIPNGSFSEDAKLNPTNPYSATKAAAEIFAMSLFKTHSLPVIITRSANNYGPYQFPEKILPLFITNLIDGKRVPLMWSEENPGLNVRDWLYVLDNCRAIWFVATHGQAGETYNIPGENETTNFEITKKILANFGFGEEMIEKVPHRKAHDFRYSISGDKLRRLGFHYAYKDLNSQIKELVKWHKDNSSWWRPLKEK